VALVFRTYREKRRNSIPKSRLLQADTEQKLVTKIGKAFMGLGLDRRIIFKRIKKLWF